MGRVMKHYEGFRKNGKTLCGIPIVDEGVVGSPNRYKRRHVRPSKVTKDRELVTCRQCLRNHGMGVVREDELGDRMSRDPYISRREPGPETRNRETATSITNKADRLLKALRSLHALDRYAIARTVVDPSSEQGRARRALLSLGNEISTMFREATGTEVECERCQGTGIEPASASAAVPSGVPCPDCDGAGVR